jgi:hypothetical protein
MDGQGRQDRRTDLRFEISNPLILPTLSIHVNSSVGAGRDKPCPYNFAAHSDGHVRFRE